MLRGCVKEAQNLFCSGADPVASNAMPCFHMGPVEYSAAARRRV